MNRKQILSRRLGIFILLLISLPSCDHRISNDKTDHLLCCIRIADITPDELAFEEGGYEVDQAYIYLGEPSPLLPASDSIFMGKINTLIRNLL